MGLIMEIIIIRHGQTESNVQNRYVGWTDVPLNKRGFEQVDETCKRLEGFKADKIYTSPLLRAYQTAEILQKQIGGELIIAEELREHNFGIFDNLSHSEILENHKDHYSEWIKDWINFRISEGESAREVYERNNRFIKNEVLKLQLEKVVVVSHFGCIRNILSILLDIGIEKTWHFKVDNASITKVKFEDGYPVLTLLNG